MDKYYSLISLTLLGSQKYLATPGGTTFATLENLWYDTHMHIAFILSDEHHWSLPVANKICHELSFTQR